MRLLQKPHNTYRTTQFSTMAPWKTFALRAVLAASMARALCLGDQIGDCCKENPPIGKKGEWHPPCTWFHIVKSGDSRRSISERYLVSFEDLQAWNCFLDSDGAEVSVGTTICVCTAPRIGRRRSSPAGSRDNKPAQLEARSFTHSSNMPMVTVVIDDLWGPVDVSTTELPTAESAFKAKTVAEARISGITAAMPVTTLQPEVITKLMTDSCDAGTSEAEDCRIIMNCDKAAGLYPTCDNGVCRCLAIPCKGDGYCRDYNQCRNDDEQPSCRPEPILYPDEWGICACKPAAIYCMR